MRKILFALLILLIAAPSFAGGGATMMMIGGTATGVSYTLEQGETGATSGSYDINGASNHYGKGAQFLTDGDGVSITKVTVCIFKNGSPTANLTAYIHASDGSTPNLPTGAALGTSDTVSATTIPATDPDQTTASYTTFLFSSPVSLSAATKYFLVIIADGYSTTDYAKWSYEGTGATEVIDTWTGAVWANTSTASTLKYEIYK